MTMVNVVEVFQQCEYPFYKNVSADHGLTCTLYSVSTPYVSNISVPYRNFDATVHMLSLEIIKLRSQEWCQA